MFYYFHRLLFFMNLIQLSTWRRNKIENYVNILISQQAIKMTILELVSYRPNQWDHFCGFASLGIIVRQRLFDDIDVEGNSNSHKVRKLTKLTFLVYQLQNSNRFPERTCESRFFKRVIICVCFVLFWLDHMIVPYSNSKNPSIVEKIIYKKKDWVTLI